MKKKSLSLVLAFITTMSALFGRLAVVVPNQTLAVSGYGPNLTANFLSGNDSHPSTGWSDYTTADLGNTVQFYLEIHNTNVPSDAENLIARVFLPDYESGDVTVKTFVSTTSPTTVSGSQTNVDDATVIHLTDVSARLMIKSDSTKVTADLNGDGNLEYDNTVWSNDDIVFKGINLGTLQGGSSTYIQISFEASVVTPIDPNLTVKYLSKNISRSNTVWGDATEATNGETVKFYIEVDNTNVPSAAENITVKASNFSSNVISSLTSTATVESNSANTATDDTSVTISPSAKLLYKSGSTHITWDQNGDGDYNDSNDYLDSAWSNDDIISSGIVLGTLYGCNNYIIQISFEAKVETAPEEPEEPCEVCGQYVLSLNKKIVWQGNEYDRIEKETHLFNPGEEIIYKIYYQNIGDADADNVKIYDHLPNYLEWINGGNYNAGDHVVSFDIGTVEKESSGVVSYKVKVKNDLPVGNDFKQENRAELTKDGAKIVEDTAYVWVNAPEILAAVAELPKAGGEGMVELVCAGLALVGAGLVVKKFFQ